jgi:hypothetical protein
VQGAVAHDLCARSRERALSLMWRNNKGVRRDEVFKKRIA